MKNQDAVTRPIRIETRRYHDDWCDLRLGGGIECNCTYYDTDTRDLIAIALEMNEAHRATQKAQDHEQAAVRLGRETKEDL